MSQTSTTLELELEPMHANSAPATLIERNGQLAVDTTKISNGATVTGLTLPLIESTIGPLRKGRLILAIIALAGVNFLGSVSNGLLIVGLPRIASDIGLPSYLLAWPSAVSSLASGSCLLLAGSIADVVGNRIINLTGCLIMGCFIVGCGLAKSGIELIMFRALQGIAVSLCLPTSVSIIANAVPSGRKRNIAFSCLGFVQPIGFSLGLVLEGVILDTVGWRFGYYMCGGLTLLLFLVSCWALPEDELANGASWARLRAEVDWVGAMMASTSLALFSYVLATLTSSTSSISNPANISMISISVLLVPAFIFWERRRERRQQPALIPNSLWKNTVFTSICLMVLFSNAIANAMELFCSLFFQEVQNISALQTSIRIIPSLMVGFILQVSTGLLIHRIPAFGLVMASLILSAGSPLLMALIDVRSPYWYNAFFAQLLSPISADLLFTVGLLVVSDVFPIRTQALAGAIFNTVTQFGTSVGLTLLAVIAASATDKSNITDKSAPAALMIGYRASYWGAFATMALACAIGAFGLRKIGRIGLKRD